MKALITRAVPGWDKAVPSLPPGAHVALLADSAQAGVEGRLAGLELRDAILVLRAGPTSGFVFMFRKPVLGTVAAQVVETGTGGINVDACRVKHANAADLEKHQAMVAAIKARGGSMANSWKNSSDLAGANDVKEGGRWPPNVLMVHSPGCRNLGGKRVKGAAPTPSGFDRYNAANASQGYRPGEYRQGEVEPPPSRLDAEGMETVPAWECEDGCPVLVLDTLTGILTSGSVEGHVRNESSKMWRDLGGKGEPLTGYGDSGGASRFYPQFEDEDAMLAWLDRLITPADVPIAAP